MKIRKVQYLKWVFLFITFLAISLPQGVSESRYSKWINQGKEIVSYQSPVLGKIGHQATSWQSVTQFSNKLSKPSWSGTMTLHKAPEFGVRLNNSSVRSTSDPSKIVRFSDSRNSLTCVIRKPSTTVCTPANNKFGDILKSRVDFRKNSLTDLSKTIKRPKITKIKGTSGGKARFTKEIEKNSTKRDNRWVYGSFKSAAKWENQFTKRGWTSEQVTEAITKGKSFNAVNRVNKLNRATRYVHPKTGQSVVIDNVTRELLHVGAPGHKY